MNLNYCVKKTQDWAIDCFHCMSHTPSFSFSFSPEYLQGIHVAFFALKPKLFITKGMVFNITVSFNVCMGMLLPIIRCVFLLFFFFTRHLQTSHG